MNWEKEGYMRLLAASLWLLTLGWLTPPAGATQSLDAPWPASPPGKRPPTEFGASDWLGASETTTGFETSAATSLPEPRAQSPPPTHEELLQRLDQLEAELDETREALDQRVSIGGITESMRIVGRIHLDYWSFPHDSPGLNLLESGSTDIGPLDRFGFRRLRLGVQGDLPGNMRYRFDLEFAEASEPQFKDAYLGWRDLPLLQTLRIGNQKRPYSLDQLNSSNTNIFLERPMIAEAFNLNNRRLAILSLGTTQDQRYNWQYGVMNMREVATKGNYLSDHYQLEVAGRLASTFWYDETSGGRGYGHWAIAASSAYPDGSAGFGGFAGARNEARYRGRMGTRSRVNWLDTGLVDQAENQQLLAWEGVLNYGAWQVGGEYQNMWVNREAGSGTQVALHGGYAYAAYMLTGEHMQWNRNNGTIGRVEPFEPFFWVNRESGGVGRGWGAWQVSVRYDRIDLNDDDIFGGVGTTWTAGLNWYWSSQARLQMNYVWGNLQGRDSRSVVGGPVNLVGGEFSSVGVRAMVFF